MLLFSFSLHGKRFPPSLPLFPSKGGVVELNATGSWLYWLDEESESLGEILILSHTECPERTLLHGPETSSSQREALGAQLPPWDTASGVQEWKISNKERALTW